MWSREYQRRKHPEDAAPEQVFTLEGQQVVDVDSFYCALGEAINGPGGYFGWNLDAVDDCLGGRFGASPPFTLEWQHSDIARSRLVDHHAVDDDTTTFEVLLKIFGDHDIKVILR